jgi:hypothetical protein
MPHLESGVYVPSNAERVTVWPAPDKDGDGPEVWEDRFDGQGNYLGRSQVKDNDGNPIRQYAVPDGFLTLPIANPGSGGQTETHVRKDERGQVWRHPRTGEAAEIRPGTTLVEKANGDFELLTDEYSQYLYAKSHDKTSDSDGPSLVEPVDAADRDQAERDQADREEFEAWKRDRDNAKSTVVDPEVPTETPGETDVAGKKPLNVRGRK